MNDETFRLSVRLARDEDPELYDRIARLPDNNLRRRVQVLRLLRLGLQAEQMGMTGSVPAQPILAGADVPGASGGAIRLRPQPAVTVGASERMAVEQIAPVRAEDDENQISAEDISAVFGMR